MLKSNGTSVSNSMQTSIVKGRASPKAEQAFKPVEGKTSYGRSLDD